MFSTDSDSAALVLLTEAFSRSRRVGSTFSGFPKREIMRLIASQAAQPGIVAEALAAGPLRWLLPACGTFQSCEVGYTVTSTALRRSFPELMAASRALTTTASNFEPVSDLMRFSAYSMSMADW